MVKTMIILDRLGLVYSICDLCENSRIKIVMAKVEEGRILFETVNAKTIEEMLSFPFKK